MMTYEVVVGLEVHLQLSTTTKLFCGCITKFGGSPNSQTCPVCLGLPGVLPVLNARAFEWGIRVATALDCELAQTMTFDRKQYFYPDLPKNYQISQFDNPLAQHGYLHIAVHGQTRKIRIRRAHLEEDAGKLLHEGHRTDSFVDFNRAGVPLLEIVSEPDLRSADEAYEYLVNLKTLLRYLDVSTCNMEEGSLRCDTNISLRPAGSKELGSRVEIKNLNSFRAVRLALGYEIRRQSVLLDQQARIPQETRLWNEKKQMTDSMRSKEEASDYRYFPEPDLVPFVIDGKLVERVRKGLPELPAQRRKRFMEQHGLSAYDAGVLTQERSLADLFEATLKVHPKAKPVANWIMGDLSAYLNANQLALEQAKLRPEHLGHLLQLIEVGTISGKMAKELLPEVIAEGTDPAELVKTRGLKQIVETGALEQVADDVINANPKSVEDFGKGKMGAVKFLVGQAMRHSQGKANPQQLQEILRRKLEQAGGVAKGTSGS